MRRSKRCQRSHQGTCVHRPVRCLVHLAGLGCKELWGCSHGNVDVAVSWCESTHPAQCYIMLHIYSIHHHASYFRLTFLRICSSPPFAYLFLASSLSCSFIYFLLSRLTVKVTFFQGSFSNHSSEPIALTCSKEEFLHMAFHPKKRVPWGEPPKRSTQRRRNQAV